MEKITHVHCRIMNVAQTYVKAGQTCFLNIIAFSEVYSQPGGSSLELKYSGSNLWGLPTVARCSREAASY